jgi:hypothetical protein
MENDKKDLLFLAPPLTASLSLVFSISKRDRVLLDNPRGPFSYSGIVFALLRINPAVVSDEISKDLELKLFQFLEKFAWLT